jgi:hypothetical protein
VNGHPVEVWLLYVTPRSLPIEFSSPVPSPQQP